MSKSINILTKCNKELDAYDMYDLTESPAIMSIKSLENRELVCVGNWVMYETENNAEELITVLAIQDSTTGQVYAGQSKTFQSEFEKIVALNPSTDDFWIEALKRRSKAGRDYMICALVSPEHALARLGNDAPSMPKPEKKC